MMWEHPDSAQYCEADRLIGPNDDKLDVLFLTATFVVNAGKAKNTQVVYKYLHIFGSFNFISQC